MIVSAFEPPPLNRANLAGLSEATRALTDAGRTMAVAMSRAGRELGRWVRAEQRRQARYRAEQRSTPLTVAGQASLMLVRAGLDPAYATTPDPLVQFILRERWLSPAARAEVAAAACRGWAVARGPEGTRHVTAVLTAYPGGHVWVARS